MRLIDADKIYNAVERRYQVSSGIEHRCERDLLELICLSETVDATPVDAIEVVRCKDCKHRGTDYCPMHYKGVHANEDFLKKVDNDFCSYGERKGGDERLQGNLRTERREDG